MLLSEAYARERTLGEYKRVVKRIRRKMNVLSTEDMADMFGITAGDREEAIAMMGEHPDRDDERIAGEMDREDDD